LRAGINTETRPGLTGAAAVNFGQATAFHSARARMNGSGRKRMNNQIIISSFRFQVSGFRFQVSAQESGNST
jgi:hypothetical protein